MTVAVPVTPAVILVGKPARLSVEAAAGVTVMLLSVPLSELFAVSVAVSDWTPAVFKVALKLPVPLVRATLAGNTASGSLVVKCTVPV